ncbi:hypothetical protein NGB36_22385 [Streptomyces sp. RB6PN25]|uniref:Lipopolysaccharide biosynthesis protein n=1 Tax=Streptomyces humicola TaxID=2953240 RepID=A0ABT1Q027_9ACTN|nr:hypothetical protein [Streptomyces humicola]MCQ4083276.1 hypothetical protein [Streptomyces humicola]
MLNTGVSAVLGLGYWLVAARYYPDAAVGRGSAAIAAMKFLAGIAAVTLTGALARFIPVAGKHTARLVVRTYLASAAVVTAAALVFLLTLGLWGPSYHFLHGLLPGLAFIGSVIAWSVLTLQDGVLTGLRSAVWVPVGNTVFSTGKLVLLVVLAALVPATGVFVSWVAAIALSVLPLGWLVFRRLIPRHIEATRAGAVPPTGREVRRFLAGDCTGSLFALAVVYLVPVLVASRISPQDNAYFYVTSTIGSTVDLLAINMGASLTVEGAHDPSRIAENCRAALGRMARIMIPICMFLAVFASPVLHVFGPAYAAEAAPLLRLMALASLTRVLFEAYFGVLRAQSRTSRIAVLQGLLCVLVLGSTMALLHPLGIVGAGVAELASQSVIAVVACFGLAQVLRARPVRKIRESSRTRMWARVRRTWRGRAPGAGSWVTLVVALALYWLPLRGMNDASLNRMNGLGLISVLPPLTLLGSALLVVAFCWGLWLRTPRTVLLLTVLLATVVSLHGVPALLEAQPRFATAWQHAGFIEYIDRTGTARPYLDARFSWPGFFAAVALVTKACGISDLTQVLRWWPLAVELLYLAPMMLLLRAVRAGWRTKWCAAWLFALCGWVGQDYFSPQSVNYFFYLMFVAVLLVWFGTPGEGTGPIAGEAQAHRAQPRERAVLLVLVIALFAASVVSHQLTPFVMTGVVAALVVWRRVDLRGLPLLCGVMVICWVAYLAEPYWSGHWGDLFGSFGSLGANVTSSVSGRIQGGSSTHKLVLYARVGLAAGVLALAAYGWLRRRRTGYSDRAMLILLLVPFLGFGMQSYGGEMALRVFLFALPGASVLAALAFFPRSTPRPGRPWRGPLAALLAGLVLMGGFLVARWGNEPFERVRTGEVAAMDFVYDHDSPSARLLWPSKDPSTDVTPNLPWMARDMEKVDYVPVLAPHDPTRVGVLVDDLRSAGPNSYLIVSSGLTESLELDGGYPSDWPGRFGAALTGNGQLKVAMSDADATVYQLSSPPAGRVPRPVTGEAGPVITWTPWTVAGVIAALALIVLLGARELARVLVAPQRRGRGMRLSLIAAVPLLVVVLISVVDRFVTLS